MGGSSLNESAGHGSVGVRARDLLSSACHQFDQLTDRRRSGQAAALIFHETPRGEDERELLGDTFFHRRLLNREADIGQAELLGVRQGRVFRDELDAGRVDRLAVYRDRVRQTERVHACLAVAVRNAAVFESHALDSARQIE